MNVGGNGALYRPSRYKGQWKDNMKHGVGVLTYLNGMELDGDFVNGHPHGNILVRYPCREGEKKRLCRQGRWVRGKRVEWFDYTEEEEEVASEIASFLFNTMANNKEEKELEELGLWGDNKIPEFKEPYEKRPEDGESLAASSITDGPYHIA